MLKDRNHRKGFVQEVGKIFHGKSITWKKARKVVDTEGDRILGTSTS